MRQRACQRVCLEFMGQMVVVRVAVKRRSPATGPVNRSMTPMQATQARTRHLPGQVTAGSMGAG